MLPQLKGLAGVNRFRERASFLLSSYVPASAMHIISAEYFVAQICYYADTLVHVYRTADGQSHIDTYR